MVSLNLSSDDATDKCAVYASLRDYESGQVRTYDRMILVVAGATVVALIALMMAIFIAKDTAVSIATGLGLIVTGGAAGFIKSVRDTHVQEREKWVERLASECS